MIARRGLWDMLRLVAMSIAFTARWDDVGHSSAIIEMAGSGGDDAIGIISRVHTIIV